MAVAADTRLEEIQAELDGLTEAKGIECVPGIAMAIFDGERMHYLVSGTANRRTSVPVRVETLYRIASITKLYTATLVMQLVDAGRVDLDRPVVEQLPEFRLANEEDTAVVTPRHLLTHTSGISGDIQLTTGRGDDAVQQWVAQLATVRPLFKPGVTHSYSNAGYNVLGRLVEYVLGMTWDAAIQEKIVTPLALKETVTLPEDVIPKHFALGNSTDVEGGELKTLDRWSANRGSSPCGRVSASVRDLMAFARMHLDGGIGPDGVRLLSSEVAASMMVPQVKLPRYSLADQCGLGFYLHYSGDRVVPGHGGNVDSQTGSLQLIPDRHAAVAILTNSDRGSIRVAPLRERVLEEWFGICLPKHLEAPEEEPDTPVEPYLGTYDREDMVLKVAREDGELRLAIEPKSMGLPGMEAQSYVLRRYSEEGVFLMVVPGSPRGLPVVFERWSDGRLYLHSGGRSTPRLD